jgi:hypothetical protein
MFVSASVYVVRVRVRVRVRVCVCNCLCVQVVSDAGLSLLTVTPWTLAEKAVAMYAFQFPRHDHWGLTSSVGLTRYGVHIFFLRLFLLKIPQAFQQLRLHVTCNLKG